MGKLPFHKKRILLTAGPTREYLDPVRFLTNDSSGEMGYVLAKVFARLGGHVTLVTGPTVLKIPSRVRPVSVTTAVQMDHAVRRFLPRSDVFVATAAVGDYRFKNPSAKKIKKDRASFKLDLVQNPDILAGAGRWKKKSKKKLLLIGFALETHDLEKTARKKMRAKNLDLIIGNSPRSFSSPSIKPLWVDRSGSRSLPRMAKSKLARKITSWVSQCLKKN